MISKFVNGTPKAQPRVKATRRGSYTSVYTPNTANGWKSLIKANFAGHKNSYAKNTPVELTLHFRILRPKSHYKKLGGLTKSAPRYHTQKPDGDNMTKAVMDALSDVGVWHDDCQVIKCKTIKDWVDCPTEEGCHIVVEEGRI